MNELFDKLILRVVFTLFLCLVLFLYKYAHSFLYPSSRHQLFKRFFPSKNSSDTLHFFSRIIGVGIIFSESSFNMSEGIYYALFDFMIQSITICGTYLLSIYIIESIVLYNFEYHDEIIKRKNFSYSLISFANSLGLAYIIKTVVSVRATLKALKETRKDKKVVVVFEPHRYTRTRDCWNDFLHCFNEADEVHISPIYPASEKEIPGITTDRMIEDINRLHPNLVNPMNSISDLNRLIDKYENENVTLMTLGAGSIGRIVKEWSEKK